MAAAKRAGKRSRENGAEKAAIAITLLVAALVLLAWTSNIHSPRKEPSEGTLTTVHKMEDAPQERIVHQSSIAGSWYPKDPLELSALLDSYLAEPQKQNYGRIRAIMVPHAGYQYSGQVAAYAYAQTRGGGYNKVLILAPSHRAAFRGASIGAYTHYSTPLGEIPVSGLAKTLLSGSQTIKTVPEAHIQEHADEIQIPFLQKTLANYSIIPIVCGQMDEEDIDRLADELIRNLDESILIVASSDLSHYHPYDRAVLLDTSCINSIESGDYLGAKRCEMCGYCAVLTTMNIAKKMNWSAKILKYANSGDVTGERSSVVGYAAIVFYENASTQEDELSTEQKAYLLKLARDAITRYVNGKGVISADVSDPKLLENRGVFVTLTENGELRGCIGHLQPVQPLYRDVIENAINAAAYDRRFQKVRPEELDRIKIEISILSLPQEMPKTTPEGYLVQLRPGVDGVILEQGGSSATYLPQVWEQIQDKEQFLSSLCRKAGLSADCWKKSDAKIYRYTVKAFKEGEV